MTPKTDIPASEAAAQTAPDGLVRVLPEALANKIAAGEVVQRPASVLKELMENALDAGARQVTVVLQKAGSELIQVVDDGCGMGPADAATCFGRHATSKITDAADLERIRTLGFRGEALASIAAVAQVELKSKRRSDAAGTCVRIEGSTVVDQSPCAAPNGTSIAVRNLFFNVPARRNFLKSPATEFKHLVETFQFLALSNPTVGFALVHDDAEVYRLAPPASAGAGSDEGFEAALRQRVGQLLGDRRDDALVRVEEATSYLSVRGLVGRPEGARRSRGEQFLFINGRYVKNRSLDHAVATAFGDLLPKGAYPLFTLFFTLDPRHVDVNVHPTKTEVKFDDERGVYGFVRAVVKKALGDADITPSLGDGFAGVGRAEAPPAIQPVRFDASPGPEPTAAPAPRRVRFGVPEVDDLSRDDAPRPAAPIPSSAEPFEGDPLEDEAGTLGLGERPPVWQLHHRYIVTPVRSGLMLFDQRAAHERILYEQALASLDGGLALSQQLLFPVTIEFPAADYELILELATDLQKLGFDLAPSSGRTVKVQGVPTGVSRDSVQRLLEDVLDQYKQYRSDLHLSGRESLAKSIARRSAVAPGTSLPEEEARKLIDELFACAMPYTCPHGRPTMIKVSMDELERRFGRG
ncbi:MAG: DNA mismatch repair endonuclease MutL [Bacteroidota bacterium]